MYRRPVGQTSNSDMLSMSLLNEAVLKMSAIKIFLHVLLRARLKFWLEELLQLEKL